MTIRTRTEIIVIHCSATPASMDIDAAKIRKWHTDPKPAGRGWADIGYHFVIRRDGTVETGRDLDRMGAHVRGHNDRSIGICLIGGVNEGGKPDCNFTRAQWAALAEAVSDMLAIYPDAEVIGHRDLSDKACPCFDAKAWWE